jgi:hypothetical protein
MKGAQKDIQSTEKDISEIKGKLAEMNAIEAGSSN